MSVFEKQEPCDSVKIWSREIMTSDMFDFGYRIFQRFNSQIQIGDAGVSGCIYSNGLYAAHAKKTKAGCCVVIVWMENAR